MLIVRGLRKVYVTGRAATMALDGVGLSVERGAFASVLGPSGSGKTTLLRCIAGFEMPDAGSITLDGRDLVSATVTVRPHGRNVGVVPQEGALFPHLTVERNIAFGIGDRPRAQRRARVEELLELVGLPGLADRRPHQLSGGQQQRVALARALAPEPSLILLDEPFSALDAQLRVELREEVRQLMRRLGTTTLLVTHDQAEALTLADHLVVMREGRVVAAGDPHEVYDHPADVELGRFLGEAVALPGTRGAGVNGAYVDCALGRLPVVSGRAAVPAGPCQVLVRPEQLSVSPAGGVSGAPDDDSESAGAAGVVVAQSFYGHDAIVRVRLKDQTRVSVRVPGAGRFAIGERVRVGVQAPVTTYPLPGVHREPEGPG